MAVRVGYTAEFAFAKAFKRGCGIAPGRYRREPQEAMSSTQAAAPNTPL